MRKFVFLLLITSFLYPSFSMVCELSDDYLDLKKEYLTYAKERHSKCIRAVSDAKMWYRVSQCIEKEKSLNVGGGCEHSSGNPIYGYEELPVDEAYCEILHPSSEKMRARMNYLIDKQLENTGSSRCK